MPPVIAAAPLILAGAAVGGTAIAASQANRQNKEVKRQKSIAADRQREQAAVVAEQDKLAQAEQSRLDADIQKKQRAESESAKQRASSTEVRKRRTRGRRSLITGSALGVEEQTLG